MSAPKTILKPCPCGATPSELHIDGETQAKYAYASGNCCNGWSVEFSNNYNAIGSNESNKLATDFWNCESRVDTNEQSVLDRVRAEIVLYEPNHEELTINTILEIIDAEITKGDV